MRLWPFRRPEYPAVSGGVVRAHIQYVNDLEEERDGLACDLDAAIDQIDSCGCAACDAWLWANYPEEERP